MIVYVVIEDSDNCGCGGEENCGQVDVIGVYTNAVRARRVQEFHHNEPWPRTMYAVVLDEAIEIKGVS